MVYIYILKLQQLKYYVGKTYNPIFRLENHFNSNGSYWTKKYRPISLLEIIENCDDYDEDKYTIKYMDKYGIDNVRGGSFCEIKLSEPNLITLNQMIKGANNRCYICNKNGHFAKDCSKFSVKKENIKPIIMNRDKEEKDKEEKDCCYYFTNIMVPFFRPVLSFNKTMFKNKNNKNKNNKNKNNKDTEEELTHLCKKDTK